MHWKLHAAYALEKKIEETAVLLKRQAVEDQGIYNAHLSATPMELLCQSALPMTPLSRKGPTLFCWSRPGPFL